MIFLKYKTLYCRAHLDNLFINPLPNFECHSIFPLKQNPRGKNVGNFQKIKKRNSQNVPKPEKCNAKRVFLHL